MVFSNTGSVAELEVVTQSQVGVSDQDQAFMARALELARRAQAHGEVPVGAVVVQRERVVGEGYNRPIATRDPTAHAEIEALRAAGQALGAYRLPATTLYVTLEPCAMCVGALIHARVARLVFGAHDPKTGACGGALRLIDYPSHNHRIALCGGVLAETCSEILRAFFRDRRVDGARPLSSP
ncbi:tRNA adenosine(34) deaminase TadA [Nitrococcus mobilis]|uniref:tRNA-specific adenosine deaminase n=1 Tax=Nitrococcus mobilis Nb-231 TaxID=314278 RepID=A4BV70_9GAMM|nr:tRNA adenosine(34) deaminase TadA [Nitrococcus mobilis]EAR20412.1 zinc-binding domain protein [Nitrococcus mobilis Nb-231]